jgi:hypothetical protein
MEVAVHKLTDGEAGAGNEIGTVDEGQTRNLERPCSSRLPWRELAEHLVLELNWIDGPAVSRFHDAGREIVAKLLRHMEARNELEFLPRHVERLL